MTNTFKPIMNIKIRLLFLFSFIAVLGCNQKNSTQNTQDSQKPSIPLLEQYVSLDCQNGDITLTLNKDETFDLNIQLWDNESQEHIGEESIKGHWSKSGQELTLTSSENQVIVYTLTTHKLEVKDQELNAVTYKFKSNSKNFFGTNFDLLDKNQLDTFFKKAIKN